LERAKSLFIVNILITLCSITNAANGKKMTGIFRNKINKMRSAKSSDYLCYCNSKEVEEEFLNSGEQCCQAIENAGGVPYELIFGQAIGVGYYTKVGDGIRQLLGVTPEEFTEEMYLGMIEDIIPLSEDIPADQSEIREKFINGKIQNFKAEILLRTHWGEKKWVRDSSLPMRDQKTGKVIGSFGIFFDISERKQSIVHLARANEKAEESDRLKTAFLNNLSHEIRTPLNAIVGFSTLLGEPGESPERRKEFLNIITHSTDHLLEILDDIVEISKIETKIVKILIKEVNLNSMLQRVYDRFRAKAAEKSLLLRFDAHINDKEVILRTDSFKLLQLLSNLVGNALKFTTYGKVEFGYIIKDDMVEFYVADTGIGIPKEHQEKIFNTFYQVESSSTQRYEGTGLGLSIARAYVELLGGNIWFDSHPGEGSVFYFTLPYDRKLNL
jgi:signal transduction histidine kinase